MKSYVKKQLKRLRVYLIFDINKRTKYIVKKKIFKEVGKNFLFQPRKLPSDPELISFKDNVIVASGVTFINHDVIDILLNNMDPTKFHKYYAGAIEVGNNVYIGANAIILPNVKIGNNVIIGAGAIVTKDIEDNTVVAGIPAKKISTFNEYIEKRQKSEDTNIDYNNPIDVWRKFNNEKHNEKD